MQGNLTTQLNKIKRIINRILQIITYTNKLKNTDEIGKLLETYKLWKLTQEDTNKYFSKEDIHKWSIKTWKDANIRNANKNHNKTPLYIHLDGYDLQK